MNKIFTHLLLPAVFILAFVPAFSQADCVNGRYVDEIFPDFTRTSGIPFGSNQNFDGSNQNLALDVYEPDGDQLDKRPVIVLAFGGSFIGGSRSGGDVVPLAEAFAKRGYVVVSHDYRLGMNGLPFPGPDSSEAVQAVLRGVHDSKAAVRWIHKDAATTNTYRFDTTRIYHMGVSAGGFIGLHYAYLDDLAEMPAYLDTTEAGLGGGLEGLSGNPGYSSTIHGVVNICGAIGDTSWIKPTDEPVFSLHGTQDNTVPYGTDVITLLGFFQIQTVHGSESIHAHADAIGLDNCFHTYVGEDHTPHVFDNAHLDTTIITSANFLAGLACNTGVTNCGYLATGLEEGALSEGVFVYPNPANQKLNLEIPGNLNGAWSLEVFDMVGARVKTIENISAKFYQMDRGGLPDGMYVLRITSGKDQFQTKFLFD